MTPPLKNPGYAPDCKNKLSLILGKNDDSECYQDNGVFPNNLAISFILPRNKVFEPDSERTLLCIGLSVCESIQGIDYFLTEVAQAFETLQSVVNTLEEAGDNST